MRRLLIAFMLLCAPVTVTLASAVPATVDSRWAQAAGDDWKVDWKRLPGKRQYNLAETTVHGEFSERYGNDGGSDTYEIDLCPDCFLNKLLPWLRGQGAAIEPRSFDF